MQVNVGQALSPANALTTEIIDSLSGLESIATEWLALHTQCPRATPFQSPLWLLPWTRRLFRGGKILTIAIRDDGLLAGLAPLFCWGIQQQTLSFLGAGISDYGDLLFAPGMERACVAALAHRLAECRQYWDCVDLKEIPSASALLEIVLPGSGGIQPCSVCPVLELNRYPQSMESKHRIDVRRARNKLLKHPQLQFEMADPATCAQKLDDFIQLYEARWGPLDDSLRSFHHDVVKEFAAANRLRLALLRIKDKRAAGIYAFTAGATLYCYLSGFDPLLAKLSPGAVLLGWLIEQAIAEGLTAIDFLRHPESYKYLWGARDRTNYRII